MRRFAAALLAVLVGGLVGGLALVVLGPTTAYACSCAGEPPRTRVASTDVVVSGSVLELEPARSRPWGDTPMRFLVTADTVYKGELAERFVVDAGGPGDTCAMEGIEVGRRYVFLLQNAGDTLRGSLCGGTGTVTEEQVARLLEPVAGQPHAGGPTSLPSAATNLLLLVPGVLVVLGAAWWVRRRLA